MKTHLVMLAAGMLVLQGCVSDTTIPLEGSYFLAEPAILVINPGESSTTTITAYDHTTNNPTDVEWAIGRVGTGISVSVDSSFGTVYVGNHLALPPRSQQRRFFVTLTGTKPSTFTISGDAGVITIRVNPAVATP